MSRPPCESTARRTAAIILVATASATMAACATGPAHTGALVPHASREPLHWTPDRGGTISLWVDSSASTPGWRPELVDLVAGAAEAWSTAGAPIRFRRARAPEEADVRVHWRRWQPGTARGVTRRWANLRGEIVRADVTIVLCPNFKSTTSPPDVLRSIVLHELGHALGLEHDPSTATVMYRLVGSPALTDRDRGALRDAYASQAASANTLARTAPRAGP